MKEFTLQAELWLPRPRDEVFAFFADAHNLQTLTPPWLNFEVLTPAPIAMKPKSRWVTISPSTDRNLKNYLRKRRNAGISTAPDAPVFLNIIGTKHGHPGFVTLFLEILRDLGLRGAKGQPGPRIHDLRHTFAVHRLLAWYRAGDDLAAKLPLLSTYPGHSTITGTEVYLHDRAQLLEPGNASTIILPFLSEAS